MPVPAPDVGYAPVGIRSDSDDEEEEHRRRNGTEPAGVESSSHPHTNGHHAPLVFLNASGKSSSHSSSPHQPLSSWLWLSISLLVVLLLVVAVLATLNATGLIEPIPSSLLSRMLHEGSFGLLAFDGVGGPESDESDTPRLTASEGEMVEILTGNPSVSHLSSTLLPLLQTAMHRLAVAVTILRPSIQRELWVSNCRAHTPCPFPNAALRRDATSAIPDATVRERQLLSKPPPLTTWTVDWFDTPDVDALFHTHRTAATAAINTANNSTTSAADNTTTSTDTSTPSNSFSYSSLSPSPFDSSLVSHFAPGETEEDQALSQRFQSELYAHQHPVNCSAVKVLIMDFYHGGGGFGSWNHARSIPMAIALRSGRVLIEAPQFNQWAYSIPWNECVKMRGMGGCDIFLPASSCTVPDNWRDFVQAEAAAHKESKPQFTGQGVDAQLEWYSERQFVFYSELKKITGEEWELHHKLAKEWEAETLFNSLPARLQPYRLMPECWWMRQILSYHQRLTQYGRDRMVPQVIRSLQLPQPNITSALVQRYAVAHSPSINQTAHWWLLIQAIKLTWQMHQIAPGLAEALREEVSLPLPVTSGAFYQALHPLGLLRRPSS